MLVCKIYEDPTGKDKKVYGSCNIKGYETGGWFPINSFSFGFEAKEKGGANKSAGGKGGAGGANSGAPAGGSSATSSQQKGSSDSGSEESQIRIEKPVDTGTCDLMKLAMQDRKKTKGRESKLQADIHLLSFIEISGGARATFPNLMIHLEGVLVKNWEVTGSADERAEESLALQYDRAAMKYVATRDGKEYMDCPARGWDQHEDKEFDWGSNWKQYTKNLLFVPRV
jgi:hypothetical protein